MISHKESNFSEIAKELIQKLDNTMGLSDISLQKTQDNDSAVKYKDVLLSSFLENKYSSGQKKSLKEPNFSKQLNKFQNLDHKSLDLGMVG